MKYVTMPLSSLTIIEGKAEDTIAYINEQCEKLREGRQKSRSYRHR